MNTQNNLKRLVNYMVDKCQVPRSVLHRIYVQSQTKFKAIVNEGVVSLINVCNTSIECIERLYNESPTKLEFISHLPINSLPKDKILISELEELYNESPENLSEIIMFIGAPIAKLTYKYSNRGYYWPLSKGKVNFSQLVEIYNRSPEKFRKFSENNISSLLGASDKISINDIERIYDKSISKLDAIAKNSIFLLHEHNVTLAEIELLYDSDPINFNSIQWFSVSALLKNFTIMFQTIKQWYLEEPDKLLVMVRAPEFMRVANVNWEEVEEMYNQDPEMLQKLIEPEVCRLVDDCGVSLDEIIRTYRRDTKMFRVITSVKMRALIKYCNLSLTAAEQLYKEYEEKFDDLFSDNVLTMLEKLGVAITDIKHLYQNQNMFRVLTKSSVISFMERTRLGLADVMQLYDLSPKKLRALTLLTNCYDEHFCSLLAEGVITTKEIIKLYRQNDLDRLMNPDALSVLRLFNNRGLVFTDIVRLNRQNDACINSIIIEKYAVYCLFEKIKKSKLSFQEVTEILSFSRNKKEMIFSSDVINLLSDGLSLASICQFYDEDPNKLAVIASENVRYLRRYFSLTIVQIERLYNEKPEKLVMIAKSVADVSSRFYGKEGETCRLINDCGITLQDLERFYDESTIKLQVILNNDVLSLMKENCIDLVGIERLFEQSPSKLRHIAKYDVRSLLSENDVSFQDIERIYDKSPEKLALIASYKVCQLRKSLELSFTETEVFCDQLPSMIPKLSSHFSMLKDYRRILLTAINSLTNSSDEIGFEQATIRNLMNCLLINPNLGETVLSEIIERIELLHNYTMKKSLIHPKIVTLDDIDRIAADSIDKLSFLFQANVQKLMCDDDCLFNFHFLTLKQVERLYDESPSKLLCIASNDVRELMHDHAVNLNDIEAWYAESPEKFEMLSSPVAQNLMREYDVSLIELERIYNESQDKLRFILSSESKDMLRCASLAEVENLYSVSAERRQLICSKDVINLMIQHGVPFSKICSLFEESPEKLELLAYAYPKVKFGCCPLSFKKAEAIYDKLPEKLTVLADVAAKMRKYRTSLHLGKQGKAYFDPNIFRTKPRTGLQIYPKARIKFSNSWLGQIEDDASGVQFCDIERLYDDSPLKLLTLSNLNLYVPDGHKLSLTDIERIYDSASSHDAAEKKLTVIGERRVQELMRLAAVGLQAISSVYDESPDMLHDLAHPLMINLVRKYNVSFYSVKLLYFLDRKKLDKIAKAAVRLKQNQYNQVLHRIQAALKPLEVHVIKIQRWWRKVRPKYDTPLQKTMTELLNLQFQGFSLAISNDTYFFVNQSGQFNCGDNKEWYSCKTLYYELYEQVFAAGCNKLRSQLSLNALLNWQRFHQGLQQQARLGATTPIFRHSEHTNCLDPRLQELFHNLYVINYKFNFDLADIHLNWFSPNQLRVKRQISQSSNIRKLIDEKLVVETEIVNIYDRAVDSMTADTKITFLSSLASRLLMKEAQFRFAEMDILYEDNSEKLRQGARTYVTSESGEIMETVKLSLRDTLKPYDVATTKIQSLWRRWRKRSQLNSPPPIEKECSLVIPQAQREVHETVLQKTVEGLVKLAVPGDGHCLYHAVALYLNQSQSEIRKTVSEYLAANKDELGSFMQPHNRTVDEYIEAVRVGTEWASHIEIEILMRVFGRPIIVIDQSGDIRNRDDVNRFTGKPIFVHYDGSVHYDALLMDGKLPEDQIIQGIIALHGHSHIEFASAQVCTSALAMRDLGHAEEGQVQRTAARQRPG